MMMMMMMMKMTNQLIESSALCRTFECFLCIKKTDKNYYKKDGYRQQNVRQRQKLISITDYDVCMTFY